MTFFCIYERIIQRWLYYYSLYYLLIDYWIIIQLCDQKPTATSFANCSLSWRPTALPLLCRRTAWIVGRIGTPPQLPLLWPNCQWPNSLLLPWIYEALAFGKENCFSRTKFQDCSNLQNYVLVYLPLTILASKTWVYHRH